jgi:hypothetical protein
MPQNTKDSQGGKNHPVRKKAAGKTGANVESKKAKDDSLTGAPKHGEKKTTS